MDGGPQYVSVAVAKTTYTGSSREHEWCLKESRALRSENRNGSLQEEGETAAFVDCSRQCSACWYPDRPHVDAIDQLVVHAYLLLGEVEESVLNPGDVVIYLPFSISAW